MVHAGIIIYPLEHAETVAKFYRDYIASAPEEFGAFLAFHQGPPVPFLPEEWHGKPVCVVVGMWTGDQAEGPSRWQPFLDVAPVAGSMVGPMPYPGPEPGLRPAASQGHAGATGRPTSCADLNDGAIAAHLEYGSRVPSVRPPCTSTRSTAPCTGWARRRLPSPPGRQVLARHRAPCGRIRPTTRRTSPGCGTTRRPCSPTRRPAATSTSWTATTSPGRGQLRAELHAACAEIKAKYDPAEPLPRQPEHPAGVTWASRRCRPPGHAAVLAARSFICPERPRPRRKVFGMRLNC